MLPRPLAAGNILLRRVIRAGHAPLWKITKAEISDLRRTPVEPTLDDPVGFKFACPVRAGDLEVDDDVASCFFSTQLVFDVVDPGIKTWDFECWSFLPLLRPRDDDVGNRSVTTVGNRLDHLHHFVGGTFPWDEEIVLVGDVDVVDLDGVEDDLDVVLLVQGLRIRRCLAC